MTALIPTEERRGQCYQFAFRWVADNPQWTLHHGHLTGDVATRHHDVHYDHAWCTRGDALYEPLVNTVFVLAEYVEKAKPVIVNSYTADQAKKLAFGTGVYGPWTREQRRKFR